MQMRSNVGWSRSARDRGGHGLMAESLELRGTTTRRPRNLSAHKEKGLAARVTSPSCLSLFAGTQIAIASPPVARAHVNRWINVVGDGFDPAIAVQHVEG